MTKTSFWWISRLGLTLEQNVYDVLLIENYMLFIVCFDIFCSKVSTNRDIHKKKCFCKLAKNSFSWISWLVLTLEHNMSRQTKKCTKLSIYNASCTFCSKVSIYQLRYSRKAVFGQFTKTFFFVNISIGTHFRAKPSTTTTTQPSTTTTTTIKQSSFGLVFFLCYVI